MSSVVRALLLFPVVTTCTVLAVVWAANVLWVIPLSGLLAALGSCLTCGGVIRSKCGTSLKGRVVLVTGGSSGIGLAVAKSAAAAGAHVVVVSRRPKACREELETAAKTGEGTVEYLPVDLTAPYLEIEKAMRTSPAVAAGRVEYAVLNAGDAVAMEYDKVTPEQWQHMMSLNVMGCAHAARVVAPGMKSRRHGALAFVGSQAGQVGVYGYTAYSASKFAVRGLAEALRMELSPWGVNVSLVMPPDTETPGLERENLTKPRETFRISAASDTFSASTVAKGTIQGMLRGDIMVGFGMDGWMLNHLTVGMLPADSCSQLLQGLFLWPILRLIAVAHIMYFDHICTAEARQKPEWRTHEPTKRTSVNSGVAGAEVSE